MSPRTVYRAIIVLALLLAIIPLGPAAGGNREPFNRALLRVEINSTDGDAGLQIDLDHDPWQWISLTRPDGMKILDVQNRGILRTYGLTELFSESSEPPFDTFPLAEFKALFPEGVYVFEGMTIDGTPLRSTFRLRHDFPAAPIITSPKEDSKVSPNGLVVRWKPVPKIVRYQVLVIFEDADPVREFSAFLPAGVTRISIPAEFLTSPGAYKVEVLAIEKGGNQTLTEQDFEVKP